MPAAAPHVSIIIPCYNTRPDYLSQTLDSVRAQTFRDFETVIVDDGSTNAETLAFLAALPGDVRVVRQENRGLPGARNRGFSEARGTYVLPLDSDDWIEAEFLERALAALAAHPEAAFAFAHLALFGEAAGTLKKGYNFFEQQFLNQLPYCLLMPKAIWEQAGGYDETMRQGYEDWEFNIRLGGMGHFGTVVTEPLFHYRVSSTGMLQTVSTKLHGRLWREIQRRNPQLYRLPALLHCWMTWRSTSSTYPLWAYFGWLALHRLLPERGFRALFRSLLRLSHGRRVSAAETHR